jgi:hypothetical protein
LGELVVGTSDLSHTRLPEITQKTIDANKPNIIGQNENINVMSGASLSDQRVNRQGGSETSTTLR